MKPSDINATTLSIVVLLASLFYILLIFWAGGGRFVTPLKSISASTLALVLLLVTTGYLLRFLRWRFYLGVLEFDVPVSSDLRIFSASFLMAISPGKVGEAAKSYFLKKEFDIPATPTIAAFFCERFTDVLAMIVLSSAGLLIFPRGNLILISILALQIVFLYLLQKEQLVREWIFEPLDEYDWFSPWINKLEQFYNRAGDLLGFWNLSIGTFIGVIAWGLEGYCLALIARDIGGININSATAIFIFASAVLLGTAAMLPGGLGSSEAIMVGMLMYYEFTRVDAVASTLIIRLTTLWYGVFVGFIAWILCVRILHRIEQSETNEEPEHQSAISE